MMGRLNYDQGEFFYSFRLDEPDNQQVVTKLGGGSERCRAALAWL
jgi:hypothetical protein